jgi:hypothetical protein
MLLSFAQFEREVTGERIRDKIAASKRKGLWMGGPVPLGYDVEARKLIVNEIEAELVRHVFRRYLVLPSVEDLADELNQHGHRTKIQRRASGPHRGGCIFRRGTLYHMLANPIYIGRLTHKGESFPAEHTPIVSMELWSEAQAKLKALAQGTSRRLRVQQPSLLTGLIFDGNGRAMTPSHATKPGKRYRYYVTRPDLIEGVAAWRVSAADVEKLICDRLADFLVDQHQLCVFADGMPVDSIQRLLARADLMAATIRSGSSFDRKDGIARIVERVNLNEMGIDIIIAPKMLAQALEVTRPDTVENLEPIILSLPTVRVRRGHQLRLVIPAPPSLAVEPVRRDAKLVALIADAMAARKLVLANPDKSLNALAAAHGRCRTRLRKLVALSCLAPDIATAIIEGRLPTGFTAKTIVDVDLPTDWIAQRQMLGFP